MSNEKHCAGNCPLKVILNKSHLRNHFPKQIPCIAKSTVLKLIDVLSTEKHQNDFFPSIVVHC